jgi:hypothetical protein
MLAGKHGKLRKENMILYKLFDWKSMTYKAYNLFFTIRMIRLRWMRWAGHIACKGEKRNTYRVLVGKPKRERPFGSCRHRWKDNILIDLEELG